MPAIRWGLGAVLALGAMTLAAHGETVRHDRGVKPKIVRPSQRQFNILQFERKGPLGISDIARSAWEGEPVNIPILPATRNPLSDARMLPRQQPMTWEELQAQQDARYDLFNARMNF